MAEGQVALLLLKGSKRALRKEPRRWRLVRITFTERTSDYSVDHHIKAGSERFAPKLICTNERLPAVVWMQNETSRPVSWVEPTREGELSRLRQAAYGQHERAFGNVVPSCLVVRREGGELHSIAGERVGSAGAKIQL